MKTTFPSTSENGKGNYRNLRIHTDLTAQCCSKASLEDYERVITLRNSFSLCCFALRMLNGLLSSQFPERITSCSLWAISSDGFGIPWNKATQGWVLLGTWRRATWGLCKSLCAYCKTNVKKFLVFTDKHTTALKKNVNCFTVSSQSGWEERALHVPAGTSRIPTFPCSHFNTALHPPPHLASNQGGPADVSSETTNIIPNTASRITDHYGTRFCNPFCSTSSLEIKASCVSVTLLQPEALSSSSPVSSAPGWHRGSLPSRTQLPTAVDLNAGREGCFFFPCIPSARQQN